MISKFSEDWLTPMVNKAALVAAERELALVKSVQTSSRGALGVAFASYRRFIGPWMGLTDVQADRYCLGRLHEIAANGVPADDIFIATASAQLAQLTKETNS